jgi:hypothetical protein
MDYFWDDNADKPRGGRILAAVLGAALVVSLILWGVSEALAAVLDI